MKIFTLFFSLIIALPCFSADYQPRCKDEISYAYDIYQQAIQSAKDGNCEKSLSQFKESEKQWIYLSKLSVCTKEEKEYSESTAHRIKYDIGILTKRYCPQLQGARNER